VSSTIELTHGEFDGGCLNLTVSRVMPKCVIRS